MERLKSSHEKRWKLITRISLIVTALWAIGALAVATLFEAKVWELTLNEAGDFWAGVAAPPAFYWLVLGFFQQKEELALQIEEMRQLVSSNIEQTKIQRREHETFLTRNKLEDFHRELEGVFSSIFDAYTQLPPAASIRLRATMSVHQTAQLYNKDDLIELFGDKKWLQFLDYIVKRFESIPERETDAFVPYAEERKSEFELFDSDMLEIRARIDNLYIEAKGFPAFQSVLSALRLDEWITRMESKIRGLSSQVSY